MLMAEKGEIKRELDQLKKTATDGAAKSAAAPGPAPSSSTSDSRLDELQKVLDEAVSVKEVVCV